MAKYSIRYGASLRKRSAEIKREKSALYRCGLCGKTAVKRISTSIWRCRHCGTTYAGGAYSMTTQAGENAKRTIEGIAGR